MKGSRRGASVGRTGRGARFGAAPLRSLVFALACSAVSAAHAQVDTAYDNANCEAAFLKLCPDAAVVSSSESSVAAAPLPIVGAALWEISGLVAALGGVWLAGRKRYRRRRAADERAVE